MQYQVPFFIFYHTQTEPLFSLTGTSKSYSVAARRSGYGIAKLRSDDYSVKISILDCGFMSLGIQQEEKHSYLYRRNVINGVDYFKEKRKADN